MSSDGRHEEVRARFVGRWPAYVVVVLVGGFCAVVGVAWAVFGVPGALLALAAVSYAYRSGPRSRLVAVAVADAVLELAGLGLLGLLVG